MSNSNGQAERGGRWWNMMAALVDHRMGKPDDVRLTLAAVGVWLVLFRNNRKGAVTMSEEQLSNATGLSGRHVRRMLFELVDKGLLKAEARGGRNVGPTRYRLLSTGHPCPAESTTTTGHPSPVDETPTPDTHVRLSEVTPESSTGHPCPPCLRTPMSALLHEKYRDPTPDAVASGSLTDKTTEPESAQT